MKNNIGEEYFNLLLKNSTEELEDFLSKNGNIKVECPIMFIDNHNIDIDCKEDK